MVTKKVDCIGKKQGSYVKLPQRVPITIKYNAEYAFKLLHVNQKAILRDIISQRAS